MLNTIELVYDSFSIIISIGNVHRQTINGVIISEILNISEKCDKYSCSENKTYSNTIHCKIPTTIN